MVNPKIKMIEDAKSCEGLMMYLVTQRSGKASDEMKGAVLDALKRFETASKEDLTAYMEDDSHKIQVKRVAPYLDVKVYGKTMTTIVNGILEKILAHTLAESEDADVSLEQLTEAINYTYQMVKELDQELTVKSTPHTVLPAMPEIMAKADQAREGFYAMTLSSSEAVTARKPVTPMEPIILGAEPVNSVRRPLVSRGVPVSVKKKINAGMKESLKFSKLMKGKSTKDSDDEEDG